MSTSRNQDFIRGTDGQQQRIVRKAALGVLVVAAVAAVGVFGIYPHFATDDDLHISLDVPNVGPGVAAGTKVILLGNEVGEVSDLEKSADGTVRMSLALRPDEIDGLTDSFDVDFRPQNYFGVTAVNIVGKPGGDQLASGAELSRTPTGDFTMSTMLEKTSLTVDGTLTDDMIDTMNKVIRYTDGLTPLIETGIVVADRVAQTQQALPSELLGYMNDMVLEMPGFTHEAMAMVFNLFTTKFNLPQPDGTYVVDDYRMAQADGGLYLAANNLFGSAGKLLKSHDSELLPVTGIVQALSDAMPGLLAGGAVPAKVSTLVDRYDGIFSGSTTKTLNLRLVLDDVPGRPAIPGLPGLPGLPQLPSLEAPR
ncbi:Mce family protein [Antrihabitans sp. YC2-6]|uniref:Mce family protein n=1 Tax=Antrihabitans sp. YC2-6 TaxID=2799498 RepID=UPI0018F4ADC9|nr:Mce family protein [Antrihabitans sp. YC2-6]MBJ8345176.1 Mce family protein [Antrihabitans sp. YC2-6]